jgi:hypothetical protein
MLDCRRLTQYMYVCMYVLMCLLHGAWCIVTLPSRQGKRRWGWDALAGRHIGALGAVSAVSAASAGTVLSPPLNKGHPRHYKGSLQGVFLQGFSQSKIIESSRFYYIQLTAHFTAFPISTL